jgi:predicted ArsR family transcriptional regulator
MGGVLRDRKQLLLRQLLRNKAGLSVNEMSRNLAVTRTAVRQHLAVLMRDGFVGLGATRPSGGRPQLLYLLTDLGKEGFPRHYSWFAQLLIEEMAREHGATGLRARLGRIATAVAAKLRSRFSERQSSRQKVQQLAVLMDELGYDAHLAKNVGGAPTIEADNCVFHELAMQNPQICHFDLALLSASSGSRLELHECMAQGGHVCRFRFARNA